MSEAALYRHFASKAQMFEALIDFIEQAVFARMAQILENGSRRAHRPMKAPTGPSVGRPGAAVWRAQPGSWCA